MHKKFQLHGIHVLVLSDPQLWGCMVLWITCAKDPHFETGRRHRVSLGAFKASVLVVPVQSLGKWEVCVRKGVRHKVCAKSNMQIRPAAKRTCNAGATVVFVSSLSVSF